MVALFGEFKSFEVLIELRLFREADSVQSGQLWSALIATPLWSILAAVTAPLFDGGRRRAEVERNRAVVEERLKRGDLKAIVATGSLELGIDVGDLDEVVLLQTPMSISAAALERRTVTGTRSTAAIG